MVAKRPKSAADEALKEMLERRSPIGPSGFARARRQPMMTVEERLKFIGDIRSRSLETDEDSTDLIRRDRDEG